MKIWIDPGHGGTDPGAVNGSHKEAKYALGISKKLGDKLSKKQISVYYTRLDDTFVSLNARSDRANAENVDLFISIHLNSASNKTAKGIETLVQSRGGKAEQLANKVQESLINATGALNRGVKVQNLSVTRRTKMPAILIEVGFISNNEECAKLSSLEYQELLADAIYKGILRYLNINNIESNNKEDEIDMGVVEELKQQINSLKQELDTLKQGMIKYNTVEEVPGWGKETVVKLVDKGILKGDGEGLALDYSTLRVLVMLDRAGKF